MCATKLRRKRPPVIGEGGCEFSTKALKVRYKAGGRALGERGGLRGGVEAEERRRLDRVAGLRTDVFRRFSFRSLSEKSKIRSSVSSLPPQWSPIAASHPRTQTAAHAHQRIGKKKKGGGGGACATRPHLALMRAHTLAHKCALQTRVHARHAA